MNDGTAPSMLRPGRFLRFTRYGRNAPQRRSCRSTWRRAGRNAHGYRRRDGRSRSPRPRRRAARRARPGRRRNAALRAMAQHLRADLPDDPRRQCAKTSRRREAKGRRRLHRPPHARRGPGRGDRGRRSRASRNCPIRSGGCSPPSNAPNGLAIERVATPLGVIGVIFESRPNVTADAGALCLKAGNAAILRAGSDSFRTSASIAAAMARRACDDAGLPADAILLVPTRDRAAVGAMLSGLDGNIDVIVPRGGKSLVARVQSEARVPVFAHLEGVVHVFVQRRRRSRHGEDASCSTPRCGAPASAARPRRCSSTAPARDTHLEPLVDDAARRGLRGARRRGDAGGRSARDAGDRGGLAHRISRRHHRRAASSTGSTPRSPISRPTARTTPMRS